MVPETVANMCGRIDWVVNGDLISYCRDAREALDDKNARAVDGRLTASHDSEALPGLGVDQ